VCALAASSTPVHSVSRLDRCDDCADSADVCRSTSAAQFSRCCRHRRRRTPTLLARRALPQGPSSPGVQQPTAAAAARHNGQSQEDAQVCGGQADDESQGPEAVSTAFAFMLAGVHWVHSIWCICMDSGTPGGLPQAVRRWQLGCWIRACPAKCVEPLWTDQSEALNCCLPSPLQPQAPEEGGG